MAAWALPAIPSALGVSPAVAKGTLWDDKMVVDHLGGCNVLASALKVENSDHRKGDSAN